ncbi:SGNH/GDSL hydrolase family protein [Anaeromicropila herbilytica]|uniref:SGNH hydrolase-type esterase domain-containing protein n=1 Tax=Anaeromicropila herbilytica TaxID=2785025 RepID=A0A7R7IAV0_9FIRM|nr:SGNH/GDSL hydrolase family protein [Anaeromicropila herbilytica]BCN28822.1 hypothetical protein bsdtb5_01170 [Anaeromicropila herbilytica]
MKHILKKNKMFIIIKVIAILLIVLLIKEGMNYAKSSGEIKPVSTKEVNKNNKERKTIKALTNYVTKEDMSLANRWKGSDMSQIAAVMRKARLGEKVTIACIGGSITQGTISKGTGDSSVEVHKSYAEIFFKWWSDTFPNTKFKFVNAGIGATDSYLGVHRVKKDVLDYHPDLVVVEFSVNDADNFTYKNTYDNLVRRILLSENSPAVMLLFMGQTNGASAQNTHSLVGFNYSLPMVSYKNVIENMMKEGRYSAKQLSGDITHPSALGHAIAGEMLWKYLNSIYEKIDTYKEPTPFKHEAITKECYLQSEILDNKNITPDSLGTFKKSSKFEAFPNDWTSKEGKGEIKYIIKCRNLGIMYYCTTDGLSGQFDVYIDGKKATTLDANFTGGWGNYAASKEVYTSDKAEKHSIVIKKSVGSTGEEFTVLGLLASY